MNDSFGNVMKAVAGEAYDAPHFGRGLCGPNSLFLQRVREVTSQGVGSAAAEDLRLGLGVALGFESRQPGGDVTVAHRWAALRAIAHGVLADPFGTERAAFLDEARTHFERANGTLGLTFPSANHESTAVVRPEDTTLTPRPTTATGWMVRDALEQIQGVPAVAAEATWLLSSAGKDGLVYRLVVEAVAGPPGLIVPNWWKLGAMPFRTDEGKAGTRWFVPAVQQAMTWAAERSRYRLRWHLEPPDIGKWYSGVEGRSGMMAAAAAALAVCERTADSSGIGPAILDDRKAVSAVIDTRGTSVTSCPLLPVEKDTLPGKFEAARAQKLGAVVICTDQTFPANWVEDKDFQEKATTVGQAFDLMRSMEYVFDNYRRAQRQNFDYHPAPTE